MPDGSSVAATDIMVRTSIIPTLLNAPALFYEYDIQEGDTPEIIADKYYKDSYRYWLVLFSNQIVDPQWEWPLNYQEFNDYLAVKYPTTDVYTTVYDYQETVTQYDQTTQTTTINTFEIDETTYNTLVTGTNTYTPSSGAVTITVSKRVRSIFDYEFETNESKRSIKLINSLYAGEIEAELKALTK